MGKFEILIFVFLVTTRSSHGDKLEANCKQAKCSPLPIRANSRTLWTASEWSADTDTAFDRCEQLNVEESEVAEFDRLADEEEKKNQRWYNFGGTKSQARRDKPLFCRNGNKNMADSKCGGTAFIKAFNDLVDFYDPFYPTRLYEGDLIEEFLNAFIETPVGKRLYGMIMLPDPFQGENDKYMELRDSVWRWGAEYYESKVDPAIAEKLKVLAEKMNVQQRNSYFDKLKKMWFGDENGIRGIKRRIGFRHVFVGEKKKNVVGEEVIKGLHSWHQFNRLLCNKFNPKNSDGGFYFDYTLQPRDGGQPDDVPVRYCKVRIQWNSIEQTVYISSRDESIPGMSNILFGSRPEYDFAVFSLCFHKHISPIRGTDKFNGQCTTHLGNTDIVVVGSVNRLAYKTIGNSQIVTTYFK